MRVITPREQYRRKPRQPWNGKLFGQVEKHTPLKKMFDKVDSVEV